MRPKITEAVRKRNMRHSVNKVLLTDFDRRFFDIHFRVGDMAKLDFFLRSKGIRINAHLRDDHEEIEVFIDGESKFKEKYTHEE